VLGFLAAQREHESLLPAARALALDDPRPDLHRVACPTLLVWGARDNLVPLEDGFQYARRLGSPLRVLPACGHLIVGEQPRELARAVQRFLA
jgi:pimeloyl-ACP methyl ester carboxylesterase